MKRLIFLIILIGCNILFSQSIKINEVMSSNQNNIADEDGDTPDWIEIHNSGDQLIDLNGYGISDDPQEPFKWIFPQISILPNGHFFIFASGKDRNDYTGIWDTPIKQGDTWKYKIFDYEPNPLWKTYGYDDSDWQTGNSGFGYGDDDDATILPQTVSFYIRKTFHVSNVIDLQEVKLHIDYDDGFVAYINGTEVARANVQGNPPAYNQYASSNHEANMYSGGMPDVFEIDPNVLTEGENILAIQTHNISVASPDMTMIPFLSILYTVPPVEINSPPQILHLNNVFLHTNFKISSSGEPLIITKPNDVISDSIYTDYIPTDISMGRKPEGSNNWQYFDIPTPGKINSTDGYSGIAEEPVFSAEGGFYSDSQQISLSVQSPSAHIYYTLDGSEPTENSYLYTSPIIIDTTCVIRAKTYQDANIPSRIITNTYFINDTHNIRVVSISTDPANFFDENTGIYVPGPNASDEWPYGGANFYQDWERPINIEVYEPDGTLAFNQQTGVKIYGGSSRAYPEKSLAIYARSVYGSKKISYQIFPEKEIYEYQAFVLRNSGDDWKRTLFRDAMLTGLVSDTDIERQAYCPSVVYINGQYWGIHNFREKINEHFLASNCNVDPDNITLLERNAHSLIGDNTDYVNMLDFIEQYGVAEQSNYEYIATKMDIDNFITYQITEIYVNNHDWPYNNIKYWKPNNPAGKWRWILFDTDDGFGMWNPYNYWDNSLEFATAENSSDFHNPPWATFLLRNLLENQTFKEKFINRFCDLLNTNFKPETIIAQIDEKAGKIEEEIPRHIQRWQDYWNNYIQDWDGNVEIMRTYAINRYPIMKNYIQSFFNLGDRHNITLSVNSENGGSIKINTVIPDNYPWTGEYFEDIPLSITAIPNDGYNFVGWEGLDTNEITVSFNLTEDKEITALFQENAFNGTIVINEINYHSAEDFNPGDWIELYNTSNSDIDLSGWVFKDENDDHSFVIPANTILAANQFLVLCKDSQDFSELFPDVDNYIGDFNFGLSGSGELIRIFNSENDLIDSVQYDDSGEWPSEADGGGATLELKDPMSDNSLAENWGASMGHGTPGRANSILNYNENNIPPADKTKMKIYPNPYMNNSSKQKINIEFYIPNNSYIRLSVYNLKGEKVKTLIKDNLSKGSHKILWNGTNKQGRKVSNGLYLFKLEKNNKTLIIKKELLIK